MTQKNDNCTTCFPTHILILYISFLI